MDEATRIHALDRRVTKRFYAEINLYEQGCQQPSENSPEHSGWLAAKEMDAIKKQYLADCKEFFVR